MKNHRPIGIPLLIKRRRYSLPVAIMSIHEIFSCFFLFYFFSEMKNIGMVVISSHWQNPEEKEMW